MIVVKTVTIPSVLKKSITTSFVSALEYKLNCAFLFRMFCNKEIKTKKSIFFFLFMNINFNLTDFLNKIRNIDNQANFKIIY